MKRKTIATIVSVTLGFAMHSAMAQSALDSQQQQQQQRQPQERQQPGSLQPSGSPLSASSATTLKASKLLDAKVKASSGEEIGEIEDLVIDQTTGKIQFAIVGSGGVLGVGEKRHPIPWKALTQHSQADNEFTLTINQQRMQSAPTVQEDYSDLDKPGYTITIYRFYAVPVGVGASEEQPEAQSGSSLQESQTEKPESRSQP